MEKLSVEHLENRIQQLEQLLWGIFRTLETYITYNEHPMDADPFTLHELPKNEDDSI